MPDEWINKIIESVSTNPQWNFLFLTKNPKRYLDFEFPENCWLGATADTQERADSACDAFQKLEDTGIWQGIKFLSCEPLREKICFTVKIDWLIIGAQSRSSGMPEMQPEWEWVESLSDQARNTGAKRFFKPNLTVRPKQYPGV